MVMGLGFALADGGREAGLAPNDEAVTRSTTQLLHQLLTTGAPAWAVEEAFAWGADADLRSHLGFTAVHLAAAYAPLDSLKVVAARAKDLDSQGTIVRSTPLTMAAAQDDMLERYRVLLEAGADPNAPDGYGFLPLLAATTGGRLWEAMLPESVATARLLLSHGADPSIELDPDSPLGSTMVMLGAPASLLEELVAAGMRIETEPDEDGWTLLTTVTMRGLSPDVAEFLLDVGVDASVPYEGLLPYEYAHEHEHYQGTRALERLKEAPDRRGREPDRKTPAGISAPAAGAQQVTGAQQP